VVHLITHVFRPAIQMSVFNHGMCILATRKPVSVSALLTCSSHKESRHHDPEGFYRN